MNDNLLIITKMKKTIKRLDKITENFNRNEIVLRDNIKKTMYLMLEETFMANTLKNNDRLFYQHKIMVELKMLDFYLNETYDKKLISEKQLLNIGEHLLETFILTQAWIKSGDKCETNK